MANNYKVRVQIEIVECMDAVTDMPNQAGVGVFESIISAEQAQSIDDCEQTLLQTGYGALRDALATHLSAMSRSHALQTAGALTECEVKPYRVDGEVGRITFDTYWVPQTGAGPDDPGRSLFPTLHAKEWYRTTGFKELALVHGTVEGSFRKTRDLLNRVRHQEKATPSRTLRDNSTYEGQQIQAHLEHQATGILQQHDFTTAGTPTATASDYSQQEWHAVPADQVTQAVADCAPEPAWVTEMTHNLVPYEDPTHTTHVSMDDVGLKRQKATRQSPPPSPRKRQYVRNTIAHIAHAGASYIISGRGTTPVLRLVVAFLLHNHLLSYNLIFFVDGQRTLYATILQAFAWFRPVQLILD